MGRLGDLLNDGLLRHLGVELRKLPTLGPAERSRALKTVLFLGGPPAAFPSGELVAVVRLARHLLPSRPLYLATRQDEPVPALGPGSPRTDGPLLARHSHWRPGDHALLVLPPDHADRPDPGLDSLLQDYLRALGSGALGWILPRSPGRPGPAGLAEALDRIEERVHLRLLRDRPGPATPGFFPLSGPPETWQLDATDLARHPRVPGGDQLPLVSLVLSCKGRRAHLEETLPTHLAQQDPAFEWVCVDYDCPEGTWDFLAGVDDERVVSVRIRNRPVFSMSHARNLGARYSTGRILVFLDADTLLEPSFVSMVRARFPANGFLATTFALCGETDRGNGDGLQGYGGILACTRQDWEDLRGFDETMRGWGGEDDDFRARLQAMGRTPGLFDLSLARALDHDHESRTRFFEEKRIGVSSRSNSARGRDVLRVLPQGYGTGDRDSPIEVRFHRAPGSPTGSAASPSD